MIAFLLHTNAHSFFEHIQGLAATFVAGGVGMRYLVLAARSLPEPLPLGSRLYLWFYRFCQAAFVNPDLAEKCSPKKEG